jgi:hypothetical protein
MRGLGAVPGSVGTLGVVALVGLGAAFRGKAVDRTSVNWCGVGPAHSLAVFGWRCVPALPESVLPTIHLVPFVLVCRCGFVGVGW